MNVFIYQSINYALEGIKSRFDDTEEQLSELNDRVVEITQAEQKRI